jgi:PhoD-like phosphatase
MSVQVEEQRDESAVELGNRKLVARLPKLGPLLGWARAAGDKRVKVRLWAKADDMYTSPAAVAVTAEWHHGKLVEHSARFWRVWSAVLPDTDPEVSQHFALADVELASDDPHTVLRLAFLHLVHRGEKRQSSFLEPQPMRLADSRANIADLRRVSDVEPIPPRQVFDLPEQEIHARVVELFSKLADKLELRRSQAARPIPDILSPRARRSARLEDYDVQLHTRPPAPAELCFAAACCRYPGMGFDRQLSDRALGALARLAEDGKAPAFALMLGDQIYADATAGVFDVGAVLEKYTARYDSAFGSPEFRRLTRRLPTYMLADDHEIRDGWPNDTVSREAQGPWDRGAVWAKSLYLTHQRCHGPRGGSLAGPSPSSTALWYDFMQGDFALFAFDSRFERAPDSQDIVGADQVTAFKEWLNKCPRYMPKFVLSGSVLAPGLVQFSDDCSRSRRADNWQGYPAQRAQLLKMIAKSEAENVVFVSGDYHCASVGSLELDGHRAYSVIAPPFYAPFPFANARTAEVAGIAKSELILDGSGNEIGVSTCKGYDVQGFALISVTRRVQTPQTRDDWEILVRLYKDVWRGDSPHAERVTTVRLADGKIDEL